MQRRADERFPFQSFETVETNRILVDKPQNSLLQDLVAP